MIQTRFNEQVIQNSDQPYRHSRPSDREHLHPEAVYCACGRQVSDTNPRMADDYSKCKLCSEEK